MNTITDNPTAAARRFLHVWTTMLGLTDRPDRPRVEQLVKDAYRAAGLPHPRHIIWCASPLTMAWARSVFPLVADSPVGPSVVDQLVHGPMQRARAAALAETGELAMLCGELEHGVLAAPKVREQALCDALARDDLPFPDQPVIPPFLAGFEHRIQAANFSFWAGVMPPMPILGRSLL